jgi:hypothetical protein
MTRRDVSQKCRDVLGASRQQGMMKVNLLDVASKKGRRASRQVVMMHHLPVVVMQYF